MNLNLIDKNKKLHEISLYSHDHSNSNLNWEAEKDHYLDKSKKLQKVKILPQSGLIKAETFFSEDFFIAYEELSDIVYIGYKDEAYSIKYSECRES